MLEIRINESENAVKVIVVDVDGVGNNAVNRVIDENTAGVEFIGINTDKRALQFYKAPIAIQIGEKLTKGLGVGIRPEVGEKAAEESSGGISQALKGADVAFVTYGMGGGAGTGATPVVTEITKDMGIPTVGMAAKPFRFETKTRMNNALSGIGQLKNSVDTLIVIPNDRPLEIVDRRTTMPDALKRADEVLQQAVRDTMDLINVPGLIGLDFIDVQTVVIDKGIAHIGIGKAKGDDKVTEAVKQAVPNPLLETTAEGASRVIINISGDTDLIEVNEAANYVQELVGDGASIIPGAMFDKNVQNEAAIIVIATGLDEHGANASVAKAMTGLTSSKAKVPAAGALAGQQAYAATPEATATASVLYTNRPVSQGYTTHSYNPAGDGQGYVAPKYSPSQGYAGDSQNSSPNSATALSRPLGPVTNKEMQIDIPDFLRNGR